MKNGEKTNLFQVTGSGSNENSGNTISAGCATSDERFWVKIKFQVFFPRVDGKKPRMN